MIIAYKVRSSRVTEYQHALLNRCSTHMKIRSDYSHRSSINNISTEYASVRQLSIIVNKPGSRCFLHALLTRSVDLTSPDTISASRILHTRVFGLFREQTRIFLRVDPDLLVHLIRSNSLPRVGGALERR